MDKHENENYDQCDPDSNSIPRHHSYIRTTYKNESGSNERGMRRNRQRCTTVFLDPLMRPYVRMLPDAFSRIDERVKLPAAGAHSFLLLLLLLLLPRHCSSRSILLVQRPLVFGRSPVADFWIVPNWWRRGDTRAFFASSRFASYRCTNAFLHGDYSVLFNGLGIHAGFWTACKFWRG